MRQLTAEQKAALIKAIDRYFRLKNEYPIIVDDLEECETIEKMNAGNEIFYMEANRFISDYYWTFKKTSDVGDFYNFG